MGLEIFSLEGKTAIVTGAGRNIGKVIALGLAEAGADIVVAARTAEEIEGTAKEVRERGRKAIAIPTDVRLSDQIDNLVQKSLEEFGKIDILVNHAGGLFPAKTLDMSEGAWDALIRENLKGTFLCSKAVAKVMVEKNIRGSIINTSSIAGLVPYPTSPAYAAAKAGLINFTQTLAIELAPYYIRVNAIAPGMILHAGSAAFFQVDKPEARDRLLQEIPLKRFGTPQDIVGAVIYLASSASDFVTGTVIIIDGGQIGGR